MLKVVNIYKVPTYDFYGGRAGKGKEGILGNPHSVSKYGRAGAIRKFKEEFDEWQQQPKVAEELNRIIDIVSKNPNKDYTIACFCKPMACHCDPIAEHVNNYEFYPYL